jgi:RNA polymerase sigma factor (sigma-70 family)
VGSLHESKAGDPPETDDFAKWIRAHLAVLSALAVREVGVADAEDVVQETLMRAWRRRSTYDPARGSARAWLVGVLLDQARRHRVRGRGRRRFAVPERLAAAAPAEHLDLELAIRDLPRRQREVVTLHYLADLPVAEVATVLGISEGSVKSHLFDARAKLRTALEHR